MFGRGDLVTHAAFGAGVVREVLDGGRKLRVVFERLPDIPYLLPAEQCVAEDAQRPATTAGKREAERGRGDEKPSARSSSPGPGQARDGRRKTKRPSAREGAAVGKESAFRADARQLCEALRLGVVPPGLLDRYTVGRDEEIAAIRRLLDEGRGSLVLEGPYGTGKTHMIELALNEARSRGFVTTRIAFDAVEVPPSNPLRVYREVINKLRYPPDDVFGGLAPLFSRLLRNKTLMNPRGVTFHRYLSPALYAVARGNPEVTDAVLAFVEGRGDTNGDSANRFLRACNWRGPRFLALPDWRTFSQVYLYILGGIAAWSREAGYRGLAILFDEAESLDMLQSVSRAFAETFLRYFAAATLPESELPFQADELYRGGQAVHRQIPHTYWPDQPLVAIFAFTPLPLVSSAIAGAIPRKKRAIELKELSPSHLPILAERLIGLYEELNGDLPLGKRERNRLLTHIRRGVRAGLLDSARAVARLTIEYLDLIRHRPQDASRALDSEIA